MRRPSILGKALGALLFVAACALSSAAVVLSALSLVVRFDVRREAMTLDVVPGVARARARMARAPRHARILFIGDSVLNPAVHLPVPTATQFALREGTRKNLRIFPVSFPGWSLAGEYCLLEELQKLPPARVVLEVNLRGLSAHVASEFPQAELAGFISPSRYVEALSIPLSRSGITADRLLLYGALTASGATPLWSSLLDLQARIYNLREPVERQLEERLGVHSYERRKAIVMLAVMGRVYDIGKNRESRAHAESVLGPVLAGITKDYPPLRTLAAIVRRFSADGVPPLVWIAPVNVEHLRALGIDVSALPGSVESIRHVVEGNGGKFVDLHAALPDRDFEDAGDHLTAEGDRPGTEILGRLLARAILAN